MNTINIVAPELPESIAEAIIIKWYKNIGDVIKQNEKLIDIETDKIIIEIPSPIDGILNNILKNSGDTIKSNEILGIIIKKNINQNKNLINKNEIKINKNEIEINKNEIKINKNEIKINKNEIEIFNKKKKKHYSPKMRRIISKNKFKKKEKILKDINNNIKNIKKKKRKNKKIIPMSYIRKSITKKLLNTKKKIATVTTFNEVNMSYIIKIRKKYSEEFKKKHNLNLGFLSFFVQAVVESLKYFPIINAYIEDDKIIYNENFDINIAISTSKGLIAPVLKNVDKMNIFEIEYNIKNLAYKGENNKLTIKELNGGNFTVTNGGVYGSLMSTPIINYPQSAILGMHAIQDRAYVVNKKIKILPMMYLALSYNHCLIDGKDAIQFLKKIKNIIEDNRRIMLNI